MPGASPTGQRTVALARTSDTVKVGLSQKPAGSKKPSGAETPGSVSMYCLPLEAWEQGRAVRRLCNAQLVCVQRSAP